jgi:hypothetical protein
VLAQLGAGPQFPEGSAMEPTVHFDPEVISAAAPLVLRDAPAHAVYAHHPAAALSRFYAGVPLIPSGRVALGTICLEDVDTVAFGAQDAQLLSVLARVIGRELEALAHGRDPLPPLFAAPGVFGAGALDALIAAEAARATHERWAMELALVQLQDGSPEALEAIALDVARGPRRRLALAVDDAGRLAVVYGDVTRDLVRRRVDQAVGAFAWRRPIVAAGAASLQPGAAAPFDAGQIYRAACDMLELAAREPGGKIQRLALS